MQGVKVDEFDAVVVGDGAGRRPRTRAFGLTRLSALTTLLLAIRLNQS